MAEGSSDNRVFNFSNVNVLLLDENQSGLEILLQIFTGFGVNKIHSFSDVDAARECVQSRALELIVVDQEIPEEKGLSFIKWLRRREGKNNGHVPVIVPMGHTTLRDVMMVRDSGASFVLRKPLSPAPLMQRIVMVVADPRPFVIADQYAGPDRRFKFEGPPAGSSGRRESDDDSELGDPSGENLDQDDIDALLKPRKVAL